MRPRFAREVVTRLRYPTFDDHGVQRIDYSAVIRAELPIRRCWLEPVASVEVEGGRDAVSNGYIVDGPKGADILATDHALHNGVEYEIDGDVLNAPSPTGSMDSTKFVLTRWEG